MHMGTRFSIAALTVLAFGSQAVGQDAEAVITEALSAATPQIAADATVMSMAGEVLRQGDGAYTCFPSDGPAGPMCLDAEWMRWADAWMNKKDFQAQTVGIAYMLAGDPPGGGASNTDPFAMEATPDNEWVTEGPHLMVIGPDAVFEGLGTDPDTGGPYVMWEGTPYQHIMVPTGARP